MPFAKEEWDDCDEQTIEREQKDGGREWAGKEVVTREVVNGCLHGLIHAPLPKWEDDEEAGC